MPPRCWLLLLLTLGCGAAESTTTQDPQPVAPGLRLTGAESDTVDAMSRVPAIASLGDAQGQPLAGVPLTFQLLAGESVPQGIRFAFATNGNLAETASRSTGPDGKVAVYLKRGSTAGVARIRITAPSLGLELRLDLVVEPGTGVEFDPGPLDTALVIGRSWLSPARVLDRYGNPLTGYPITIVADSVVVVSGRVLTGPVFGRAEYRIEAPPFGARAKISVVPDGILAGSSNRGVEIFNTDGSQVRRVTDARTGDWLIWSPDATQIAFGGGSESKVYVTDLAGNFRLAAPQHGGHEWAPQFSGDGHYLYFSMFDDEQFRIGRVRRDGTAFEVVPGLEDVSAYEPTVSLDGFLIYRGPAGLTRRNLATGATLDYGFDGFSARWTADGSKFAYLDGTTRSIWLAGRDGTGRRPVTSTTSGLKGEFMNTLDWSPDQQWLLAKSGYDASINIVQVSSGRVVPLPFPGAWGSISWKPR